MDEEFRRQTTRARELRNNATPAERVLWRYLSARQVCGVRFNRQVCVGPYICDFVARTPMLVVEVDGGQHDVNRDADEGRTRFLEERGYRVIRFWNNDVMERTEGVILQITAILRDMPSPAPSRMREGIL